MELNDLKAIMAATLLSGSVKLEANRTLRGPTEIEIQTAVRHAESIWEEKKF